jgi:hypothetical protein
VVELPRMAVLLGLITALGIDINEVREVHETVVVLPVTYGGAVRVLILPIEIFDEPLEHLEFSVRAELHCSVLQDIITISFVGRMIS